MGFSKFEFRPIRLFHT